MDGDGKMQLAPSTFAWFGSLTKEVQKGFKVTFYLVDTILDNEHHWYNFNYGVTFKGAFDL